MTTDAVSALSQAPTPTRSIQDEQASHDLQDGHLAGEVGLAWKIDGVPAVETPAAQVARLYGELFPSVFGFVRFRVGDRQLAEDLTATVFERALSRLATVREAERIRAWIFTIARNLIVDERRRRRPVADLGVTDDLEHLWVESPEAAALDRDEWRRLVGYLSELDDRAREVLGLRFAAGLSNREVGEIVRLSESNVAQIVHRAVVKLRRRFETEETSA
jgi:RNA polymerase sigma factor (sigma-70 family)